VPAQAKPIAMAKLIFRMRQFSRPALDGGDLSPGKVRLNRGVPSVLLMAMPQCTRRRLKRLENSPFIT